MTAHAPTAALAADAPPDAGLDQYQSLAPFYDYLIPDPPGMLAFYLEVARRHGGPVLEIGAGTGRLTLELAAAGHRVIAVDGSPPMLAALRAKAEYVAPAIRNRIQIELADQRSLALAARFPTVLVTGGTLQHCLTLDDYAAALARAHAHLAPGGALALDIARMLPDQVGRSFRRDYGTYSGAHLAPRWARIRSWDEVHHEPHSGVTRTRSRFEMTSASGEPTERLCYEFVQTFPDARELAAMLERAGFEITALHGGFAGEDVAAPSEQLVVLATRPAER